MGIDYGLGQTNIDKETGIRYGVIHQNEVLQVWADESEADYGPPHCPRCGSEAIDASDERVPDLDDTEEWEIAKHECPDYACLGCKYAFGSESAFGDEPNGFYLDKDGYFAHCDSSGDIFILKSPYYTLCGFCSPCAPGAGDLTDAAEDCKAYCFGHDWFYDHPEHPGRAPYRVFKVSDDSEVFPEAK